jgi:acetyltransferase-like isoleucine patch superfamily enzyme
MKYLNNMLKLLYYLNIKTVYFNLHYLPFRKAVRLPVLLSRNTKLRRMKGSLSIEAPLRTGMIRVGAEEIGIHDKRHHRPVWENAGKVIFKGSAVIKFGAKIIVGPDGVLTLGDNFRMASESYIICYHSVDIGDSCRISWNTQILDTDFHKIYDLDGNHLNPDSRVLLGDNNWIGHSSTITKGTELGDMVVVASNSLVNKKHEGHHMIIAGNPAKVVRNNITWGE